MAGEFGCLLSLKKMLSSALLFISSSIVIQLDYIVISELKLDDSFPSAPFAIENYEIRARRDRDGHGGGLIKFVKRSIICKKVNHYETVVLESICSEITISRNKWFCTCIYRPPNFNNLDMFFKEVIVPRGKASLTYGNFIIMGGFNIVINTAGIDVDKLDEFCNLFDLTNLMKTEICCTKNQKSTIDLFLTNRPLTFQKTSGTGIKNYYKLISYFNIFKVSPCTFNAQNYLLQKL